MSRSETNDFAYGDYGDEEGVVFYGPPTNGFWNDTLAVGGIFINPLFNVILERSAKAPQSPHVPRLISDWNRLEGWRFVNGMVEISRHDAEELVAALATLSPSELATRKHAPSPEECLHCAKAIRDFLQSRLDRGLSVYIEDV